MAPKKLLICSDYWHRWRFCSVFMNFGTHFAESFHMVKYAWMMDPTRSGDKAIHSAIDLEEIRLSCKISSWMWSIICRVVTVLGHPERGSSRVQKSLPIHWVTQFLTVAYHGAYSPNFFVRIVWKFFGALPCKKKILDKRWHLDVVEVVRVAWYASLQPL